ncbi:hypothetical protein YPPY91_3241, partial [Yersinia pestis PY-91]
MYSRKSHRREPERVP